MQLSGRVIAVNSDTLEVSIFSSQVSAGHQLGIDPRRISDILRGKLNKTRDYWFCRANENVVEKVGTRFGDKVAKKVEELIREYCNQRDKHYLPFVI